MYEMLCAGLAWIARVAAPAAASKRLDLNCPRTIECQAAKAQASKGLSRRPFSPHSIACSACPDQPNTTLPRTYVSALDGHQPRGPVRDKTT
jgi:hypothetical protein